MMGFGVSLLLIAVGAVLAWAVNVSSSAVDIQMIGYIVFGVGLAGLLLSLMFWSTWFGPGYFRHRHTEYHAGPPPA